MKHFLVLLILIFLFQSCMKGESADLVIHNAQIHTMDEDNTVYQAIAIKDGKILEVGPERQIINKYSADETIDAGSKSIYPGFIDAHGHILSYARQKLSIDLVGCKSYNEMLVRIEMYQSRHNRKFIVGRGWNQSLWKNSKGMPTNEKLNELFPDIPVCLFRIDGHAILVNDYLIKKSNVLEKFNSNSELNEGGYLILDSLQKPTGVFIDNAMNPILDILPDFPLNELKEAILEVQEELFGYGITGVHEAGMQFEEVEMMEELMEEGKFPLNLYGMLLPTEDNFSFAKEHGIYQKDNLTIRSFKVFGDGALGSRGAFLKHNYTDLHDHKGYLTTSLSRMTEIAQFCTDVNYQMNTHAIGDSTNRIMLELYQDIYSVKPDHRWRIEHAQIVDPIDFKLFSEAGVFPSVQPTHATSDQTWAVSRLGIGRMAGAYAYRTLLNQFGMIAIGTDFPVESTNPFLTIHAAVNRQNEDGVPGNGFQKEESLTIEQCLRGMTIWAAFAAFQENEVGTIEKGKDATLVVLASPLNITGQFKNNFAYMTFIKGKKVYSVE